MEALSCLDPCVSGVGVIRASQWTYCRQMLSGMRPHLCALIPSSSSQSRPVTQRGKLTRAPARVHLRARCNSFHNEAYPECGKQLLDRDNSANKAF